MPDIAGNSSTNVNIGPGMTIGNALEVAGDHDWFRISLTAGQKIVIALNSASGPYGAGLQDPYLYFRDSTGALLAQNDDAAGYRNSRIVFTAPTSGIYYIDAAAWEPASPVAGYSGTGSYNLSVYNYVVPPVGTLDQFANFMTHGYWGGQSHRFDVSQGGVITVNLTALTDTGQAVALEALQLWTDITGINFVAQTGAAQMTFDDLEVGTGAFAETVHSNGIITSATVNVSLLRTHVHTYLHEIAHALGIGHSGGSNAGTAAAIYPVDALWANDASAISIMSYFDNAENAYYADQGFSNVQIRTPQLADILAMGNQYGLSTTTRLGDTTYGFNNTSGRSAYDATQYPAIAYTIFDSGGTDTLDYSGYGQNQLINLNAEAFSNVGSLIGNVSIARGTVIENAIGGSGNDTIIGNAVANSLSGGGGNDVLIGGLGSDSFVDTIANFNGDVITDLSLGDRIIFTDATLQGFSWSRSGSTLTFGGASLTLQGTINGALVASAAAGGGVQLLLSPDARNDFNGDGRSDVLWRNDLNGTVTDWLGLQSGSFFGNGANAYIGTDLSWNIIGIGDFNGDGRADVLWRNDNGTVTNWLGQLDGGFFGNDANVSIGTASSWHVVGTGDFNGDGRDDVLWRNDNGTVTNWLGQLDGGFFGNDANVSIGTASSWHVVGTGDFNGDGRDDVLWRNVDGTVTNWLGTANGSFFGNGAIATIGTHSSWHVVGTGDFNGDGRDDVLWRNDNGTVTNWLGQANGGFFGNDMNVSIGTASSWHVVSTGDYNGDGRDDVLWRNDDGTVTNWLGQANGGFFGNGANTYINVPAEWSVHPQSAMVPATMEALDAKSAVLQDLVFGGDSLIDEIIASWAGVDNESSAVPSQLIGGDAAGLSVLPIYDPALLLPLHHDALAAA